MNSQRGKASTNASRQNKSQKQRQSTKSQTDGGKYAAFYKGIMSSLAKSGPMSFPGKRMQKSRAARSNADIGVQNSGGLGRLGLAAPVSRSRAAKSHLIEEDEYIGDINGSVAFTTTQYSINIGQSGTFPWGYKIAGLYQKYEFLSLEFYYKREVSEYATNGQVGKVMLNIDYDASDPAPLSKQQVLDTVPHVDGMPCTPKISLLADCRQMCRQDGCFVRPGTQPANTDIKTYDAGNLFVSTYGNTNSSVIGELHVRYKCLVSVPILQSAGAASGGTGSYLQLTSSLTGEAAGATTVNSVLFASATSPVIIVNGIGATIASTGLITLVAGTYLVEASLFSFCTSANAVTAGDLTISKATGGTNEYSSAAFGFQFEGSSNTSYGAKGYYNGVMSSVWDTTVQGTAICALANATYGAGSCFNQGYLKITQL